MVSQVADKFSQPARTHVCKCELQLQQAQLIASCRILPAVHMAVIIVLASVSFAEAFACAITGIV